MTTTKKTNARPSVAARKSADRDAKLAENVDKLRTLNDGDRLAAAIKERRQLAAWEKGGKKGKRPTTENLDAVGAEFKQLGPTNKRTAKKTSTPREPIAPLVDRNVKSIKCVVCNETKPSNVFPTRGKDKRATECRDCGRARRGQDPRPSVAKKSSKPAAKRSTSKKTTTAAKKSSTAKKSPAAKKSAPAKRATKAA